MSLFERLGAKNQDAGARMSPDRALQMVKSDPVGVLKSAGLSIPNEMKDPGAIINHLLQSGQIPQSRYAMAMRMIGAAKR